QTTLRWIGRVGREGNAESVNCAFDFNVLRADSMPSGEPEREQWVRSQVDRGALLAALRACVRAAFLASGCRECGAGENVHNDTLTSFTIRFESDENLGGVDVASYETAH